MDTDPIAPPPSAGPPSPEQYRALLRKHLAPMRERARRSTHLPLVACAGSVLARELVAPVDLPLFVNSQMDGYAVRSVDVATASDIAPVRLRVVGATLAGDEPGAEVDGGEARKIMTGAALPPGSDCVVPVEDTHGDGSSVLVHRPRARGEFVRSPGDDVCMGDPVLPAGVRIAERHLAAAASLGISGLDVRPRPRVGVIATGAELVAPGRPLGPGQIWESNSVTLSAALQASGCTVSTTRISGDHRDQFAAALDAASADADLVVTAGAVSMGEAEVVREVLGRQKGSRFAPIAMQPGGPQGLSTWRNTPVVCLPGNPVSALVSFVVLLRPLITEAVGHEPARPICARLARDVSSPMGRVQYLRAALSDYGEDPPTVDPVSGPGSHLVASMARADVLAEIPADVTSLAAGAEVAVLRL